MLVTFVSSQPAEKYFLWQLKVQHDSFLKYGIPAENIVALVGYRNQIPYEWKQFQESTPTRVIFYEDTRVDLDYSPSIRPHLISKWLKDNPDMSQKWWMYHDSDILFTMDIDWDKLISTSSWKLSDTISYIGYEYIASKGTDVLLDMCEIVGISPIVVRRNQKNAGGAQYLINGSYPEMWDKIENDCIQLRKYIGEKTAFYAQGLFNRANEVLSRWKSRTGNTSLLTDFKYDPIEDNSDYHPIQIWTAEMWAILWNAWLYGHATEVVNDLYFTWATSPADNFNKFPIFHNAGVSYHTSNTHFDKGKFTATSPIGQQFDDIPPTSCSWVYAQHIKRFAARSLPVDKNIDTPLVSCVMATKGRLKQVRRSIACFLAQTYTNKELIIFNNGDHVLVLPDELKEKGIRLINQTISGVTGERYSTLSQIFTDAFACAKGDIVIQWDNDDIFLPLHIENSVKGLKESGTEAWMPERSYFTQDKAANVSLEGNYFEPSVTIWRDAIWKYGFEFTKEEQCVNWRIQVDRNNQLTKAKTQPTFCYVWGDDLYHFSGALFTDYAENFKAYSEANTIENEIPVLYADVYTRDQWYTNIEESAKKIKHK